MAENIWSEAPQERLFASLFAHATAEAIAWRKQTAGKIVGYLGADVPVEIISAAGCLPFRVGVFQPSTEVVKPYLEMGDSDVVAELANALLDGSYAFLDYLVVGNSPTANITLFHFLREARRLAPDLSVPPMIFHEIHHGDEKSIQEFNVESCRRLAARLGEIGSRVDDAALRIAVRQTNVRRQEVVRLQTLRRHHPPRVTGADALALLAHWQLMPLSPLPSISREIGKLPRVLFSGSDVGHFQHYRLIEEAGCTLVADDHDWGDEALATLVAEDSDLYAAIAVRYAYQTPRASRWPAKRRLASLIDRARKAKVDGVVFWINDEDQASSWDLPSLIAALNSHGIATLDLRPQPAIHFDAAAIAAKMRRWLYELSCLNSEKEKVQA